MLRRLLSIVMIAGLLLSGWPADDWPVLAAEAEDIKIIDSAGTFFGAYGQYLEYEMDGVRYNTKVSPTHKNLEAFRRMNKEQKDIFYNCIFTNAARIAALGESGHEEMKLWRKTSSSYYRANKLWKLRIAKRNYPMLTAKYGPGRSLDTLYPEFTQIRAYPIPEKISSQPKALAFLEALAEVEKEYQIGKEYYDKAIEMRASGIANVVTITIAQCTVMLSDLLFVPSVAQMTTNEASSQIADVLGVIYNTIVETTDRALKEDTSFAEKFRRYQDGELGVPFTPEETIKLYGIMMDSYAQMAENSLIKTEAAMERLIYRHSQLEEEWENFQLMLQEWRERKEKEKQDYEAVLLESFPEEPEPPSKEYEELNFTWFTAEQLANQYGEDMAGWTPEDRRREVLLSVLAKKDELDQEAKENAKILCEDIIKAYTTAAAYIAQKEDELAVVQEDVKENASDDKVRTMVNLDVEGNGMADFNGIRTFEEAMQISGNSIAEYKENTPSLLIQMETGKMLLEALKGRVKEFIDTQNTVSIEILPHLRLLSSKLEQMKRLKEDYRKLYDSAVWVPEGYEEKDFTNPLHVMEYQDNAITDVCKQPEMIWPAKELQVDVSESTGEVLDTLGRVRPLDIYHQGYAQYEAAIEKLAYLEEREQMVRDSYDKFITDERAYFDELDKRLDAYVLVGNKMAGKFAKLEASTNGYEGLWQAAYFTGQADYYSGTSYNYGGLGIPFSAFDVNGIRDYVRGGGSRYALLLKIQALADAAAANEAVTLDLMAQISMLEVEMDALVNPALIDYARTKGIELRNINYFREEFGLTKWGNLEKGMYFQLYDIEYIVASLSDDAGILETMRNYRTELLGYLKSASVDKVKVSNRMYDIYQYASGVYELYAGNYYNQTLMSDQQRSELLKLYRGGTGEGDIEGTLYGIRSKHSGTAFQYYGLPSENGTSSLTPIGDFSEASLSGDRVKMTAPLYHPFAQEVSYISAAVYTYGENGWEPLGGNSNAQSSGRSQGDEVLLLNGSEPRLFAAGNHIEAVVDPENDTITLSAEGLENNKDYRFEWDITYRDTSGKAQHETGDIIKKIEYEPTAAAQAELEEDSCTTAVVTVTNLTGSALSNQYVYVNGYDEEGRIITVSGAALAPLDMLESIEMKLTLDKPVNQVDAYVADTKLAVPSSLLIKQDGEDACSSMAESPSTLLYTAELLDPFGQPLSGESVTWSVAPAGAGIQAEDGTVTIAENAPSGNYTITAAADGKVYDEIILTVVNSVPPVYVSVTGISGVPAQATVGMPLVLKGTAAPANATNQYIAWTVKSAGAAGASISNRNILNTTAPGTVVVTAAIANGTSASAAYTQDFTITVDAVSSDPVTKIQTMINALPVENELTLADKEAVAAVREAYDALKESQKELVDTARLTAAEARIDELETLAEDESAAQGVISIINAIPATVTLTEETSVNAARKAFDVLTEVQKLLVINLNKLTAAETTIRMLKAAAADKAAANEVITKINAIPTTVTLADKAAVTAARTAYNRLTAVQKTLVTNLNKLTSAEACLIRLEQTPVKPVLKLSVTSKSIVFGTSYTLKATVIPAGTPISYTSSKKSVAAVNRTTGKITARKVGTAVITVKAGTVTKSCKIKVTAKKLTKPTKLKLTKTKASWKNVKNNSGYTVKILRGKKTIKTAQIKKNKTSYKLPKSLLKKGTKYTLTVQAKGKGNYAKSSVVQKKNVRIK